jgi:hypothetical protein
MNPPGQGSPPTRPSATAEGNATDADLADSYPILEEDPEPTRDLPAWIEDLPRSRSSTPAERWARDRVLREIDQLFQELRRGNDAAPPADPGTPTEDPAPEYREDLPEEEPS